MVEIVPVVISTLVLVGLFYVVFLLIGKQQVQKYIDSLSRSERSLDAFENELRDIRKHLPRSSKGTASSFRIRNSNARGGDPEIQAGTLEEFVAMLKADADFRDSADEIEKHIREMIEEIEREEDEDDEDDDEESSMF